MKTDLQNHESKGESNNAEKIMQNNLIQNTVQSTNGGASIFARPLNDSRDKTNLGQSLIFHEEND